MSRKGFGPPECVIYTCCGSKCKKKGGKHIYKSLKSHLKHSRDKNVQVIKTGCMDRWKMGPVVAVMPANEWHLEMTEDQALQILQKQLFAKMH